MKTIAERIKEGMSIRNMKQIDIIEKTGINKGALSSYISGKYNPKQNNIYLIAKALDVNESWLMGFDVPMERTSRQVYDDGPLMRAIMKSDDWEDSLTKTLIQNRLTENIEFEQIDIELLKIFKNLNDNGKDEAIKRIRELTFIPDYCNNDSIINTFETSQSKKAISSEDVKTIFEFFNEYIDSHSKELNAAHADGEPTEEDIKKTDEIMDNDENWD